MSVKRPFFAQRAGHLQRPFFARGLRCSELIAADIKLKHFECQIHTKFELFWKVEAHSFEKWKLIFSLHMHPEHAWSGPEYAWSDVARCVISLTFEVCAW